MILLLLACATPDYRAADLQLDVGAPLPEGAEQLRVCVEGWGVYEVGAGNGRAAVTGLAVGAEYAVTVDVLDTYGVRLATAGPATLDGEAPYALTPLVEGGGPACEADGAPVTDDQDSWLLTVRFEEDGTPWDQP